ncbi:hypothetical protein KHA80_20160 [Anaerobacillus sp. HL2]|nr:hypothetical protein KHA80_20160 [Anaerobacillus sp. HL2]
MKQQWQKEKKQKIVEWKKQLTYELVGLFFIVLPSVAFAKLEALDVITFVSIFLE